MGATNLCQTPEDFHEWKVIPSHRSYIKDTKRQPMSSRMLLEYYYLKWPSEYFFKNKI